VCENGSLRIAIDAIPLLVRSAGVKNYLFYWISHLRQLLGDHQVSLFPFLPRTDIFHTTKLLNPPRRPRLTAHLHDLTCWLLPEFHQPPNVAAEKLFAERIWKRAAGLIAVSESTRRDAIRILGLNPDIIQVIYPGVPQPFFEATVESAAPTCRRYGLARPYALYVGTVEPRKNLDRLLDSWQDLPASVRDPFDLVAVGPEGWQSTQTMARLRHPTPGLRGVRYLGYVPEPDLPLLTAGAAVFLYPSLYEGFGFPVAQAMAAGVPVITSNLSSLPEITGGAALLIDPRSVAEIRAALDRLLTSPATRAQLSQAGRVQARRFHWDVCARQSVEFFEQVLGRG
jgi:alpha-1,3-rhamnosyl/mannosyltransferase